MDTKAPCSSAEVPGFQKACALSSRVYILEENVASWPSHTNGGDGGGNKGGDEGGGGDGGGGDGGGEPCGVGGDGVCSVCGGGAREPPPQVLWFDGAENIGERGR